MSDSFLADQIPVVEAQILALQDAVIAVSNGTQSYTLDTGQDRQVVTRYDVDKLNGQIDALFNRRDWLLARCGGGGTVTVVPAW